MAADKSFSYGRPLDDEFVITNGTGEPGLDQSDFDDSNYNGKTAYGSYVMVAAIDGSKPARIPSQFYVVDYDPPRGTLWTNFAYDYNSTYTCTQNGQTFKKYTATAVGYGTVRVLISSAADIGVTT